MKTKVMTPANETSLTQAVKDAINGAPSRPALEAEKIKLEKLHAARQVAAREIDLLVDQLAKSRKSHGDSSESKIMKIIGGGDISDATRKIGTKLIEAQGNLAAIDQVVREQQQIVRVLQGKLSGEVNLAIRADRAPFVKRIAAALVELKAACEDEIQARAEIAGSGVDLHAIDNFGYLPVLGEGEWLAIRRKQGFAV